MPSPSDDGCAAGDAGPWARPGPRPRRETIHPARPAHGHGPTRASAGAWSSSRRASAPPGAPAPGAHHSPLAFAALFLFSSSLAAPWPRHWGPFVLVDAILTPTREPSLLSSQIQQGPGHLLWLRGLDLNQRPLGYEYNTAMTGNPLILRERCSTAGPS